MPLNDDTVDIEKPDGIFSSAFVVDKFSGLFPLKSKFGIKRLWHLF